MYARQVPQSYVPNLLLHVAKINLEFAILLPQLPKELELQVCATRFCTENVLHKSVPSRYHSVWTW